MRRLAAALLTLALMGAGAGSATPAEARVTSQKPSAGTYSRQAHAATNNRRADAGLKALRRTKCVQRFAVHQAKVMAQTEHMYHQDLQPVLDQCGLTGVGENVAAGYPDGRAVVNHGWMRSDGHRANMLDPKWRLMGIGARLGHNGLWYVSQVFGRK